MSDGISEIPIDALFDTSGERPNADAETPPHAALVKAGLILGKDITSGRKFLCYGRAVLRESIDTDEEIKCEAVTVLLDPETDDLERLLALVSVIKRSHDYNCGE